MLPHLADTQSTMVLEFLESMGPHGIWLRLCGVHFVWTSLTDAVSGYLEKKNLFAVLTWVCKFRFSSFHCIFLYLLNHKHLVWSCELSFPPSLIFYCCTCVQPSKNSWGCEWKLFFHLQYFTGLSTKNTVFFSEVSLQNCSMLPQVHEMCSFLILHCWRSLRCGEAKVIFRIAEVSTIIHSDPICHRGHRVTITSIFIKPQTLKERYLALIKGCEG